MGVHGCQLSSKLKKKKLKYDDLEGKQRKLSLCADDISMYSGSQNKSIHKLQFFTKVKFKNPKLLYVSNRSYHKIEIASIPV